MQLTTIMDLCLFINCAEKNDFVEVAKFKFQKLNQVHTLVIVNSKNKIDNDNTPLHLWF